MDPNEYIEYYFISDYVDVRCDLPFEVIPSYFLKKANKIQKENILGAYDIFGHGFKYLSIHEQNDRIFILERKGTYSEQQDINLKKAFWLSSKKVRLDFHFVNSGMGNQHSVGGQGVEMWNYFDNPQLIKEWHENEKRGLNKIDLLFLKEVNEIHSSLNTLDKDEFQFICNAIDFFCSIKRMGRSFIYKPVLYVTVWEILFTIKPKEGEESLLSQLKRKICELQDSNIFTFTPEKYDYPKDKLEKFIEVAYNFRSSLVHGSNISFVNNKKGFKFLSSYYKASGVFDDFTRSLMHCAINNPEKIIQLKQSIEGVI